MKKINSLTKILITSVIIFNAKFANCCTNFAINDDPEFVYLAKNRDMLPDRQGVIVVVPKNSQLKESNTKTFVKHKQYKFLAMVSKAQYYQKAKLPDTWVIRSGVNEANLAIANMFVAYPFLATHEVTDQYDDGDEFMKYVLTNYDSVNSVINAMPFLANSFGYPEAYILADNKQIAYIEMGINGSYRVKFTLKGHLEHTNHYLLFKDTKYTSYFSESASTIRRLSRVSTLISEMEHSYTESGLKEIFKDHALGDNDSILRLGNPVSEPGSPRSIANFLVTIPKNPESNSYTNVYVKFLNLNEEYNFKLDKEFWQKLNKDEVLSLY